MDGRGRQIFATRNAKMVLREKWTRQSLHSHRPLELVVALDGPIRLSTDSVDLLADCILVPPMREHALMAYDGRIARMYLDTGYRHLAYWRNRAIETEMDGRRELLDMVRMFHDSGRSMDEAQALIAHWTRSWIGPAQQAPSCDPRVSLVLRHLDEQTTSVDADRRSVAARVGLSPGRFAALFAADTGMSLRRYLNWRRVKIGAKLVCEGQSMTNAAALAGFADSAHFTRSCRSAYGYPPSHFVGFSILQTADALGDPDSAIAAKRRSDRNVWDTAPHVCLVPPE